MGTIQDLIKSGNEKIEKGAAEIKAREERKAALLLIEAGKRNDLAVELLPEVLRQYAMVEETNVLTLVVSAPGCADIRRYLRVETSNCWPDDMRGWYYEKIVLVEFFNNPKSKAWQVAQWSLAQDDDGKWFAYWGVTQDSTDDIERALAIAETLVDSKMAAEIEAEERNANQNAPETKPDIFIPLCPLRTHGGLEFDDCELDCCAWFIQFRGENSCAMKVMGNAALETLPREDD